MAVSFENRKSQILSTVPYIKIKLLLLLDSYLFKTIDFRFNILRTFKNGKEINLELAVSLDDHYFINRGSSVGLVVILSAIRS